MNRIKVNTVIIISGMLMFLFSCKDKDPTKPGRQSKAPEHKYYEFWLNEAKEYIYFKTGSWWVYKNTGTNETDTLTCTLSSLDTITVIGNYGYTTIKYESVRVVLKSQKHGTFYDIYSRGYNPDISNIQYGYVFENQKSGGHSGNCFFFYPFGVGTNHSNAIQSCVDSTLKLSNNDTYMNTQIFKSINDDSFFDVFDQPLAVYDEVNYCVAKNIGIIKCYSSNNRTIELIEHHLIP